jgi:hypothetical protein
MLRTLLPFKRRRASRSTMRAISRRIARSESVSTQSATYRLPHQRQRFSTRWTDYRRCTAVKSEDIAIVAKQAVFDRFPMKLMILRIVCVDSV